jgi:hypothetical protein
MKIPTLVINDTYNDDWIKNVDPEMARQELEIHAALAKKYTETLKGGPGSGNFGHAGIPGHHGGSAPGKGSVDAITTTGVDLNGVKVFDSVWGLYDADKETFKNEAYWIDKWGDLRR